MMRLETTQPPKEGEEEEDEATMSRTALARDEDRRAPERRTQGVGARVSQHQILAEVARRSAAAAPATTPRARPAAAVPATTARGM